MKNHLHQQMLIYFLLTKHKFFCILLKYINQISMVMEDNSIFSAALMFPTLCIKVETIAANRSDDPMTKLPEEARKSAGKKVVNSYRQQ